jgi:hypothetical protein
MKPDYLNQSICLSRIPKEAIREDKNTGEKWISITAGLMKQPDKNNNTYTVYMTQEKGENKDSRVYIGKGRDFTFSDKTPSPEEVGNMPQAGNTDDLPY